MPKYIFSSGDIKNFEVLSTSVDGVFETAINENPSAELGLIYEIKEEGKPEDEDLFGMTERALEKMGIVDQYRSDSPYFPFKQ